PIALSAVVVACSSSNTGTTGGGGATGAITCSNSGGAPVNGLESESSSFGCDKPLALNGDAGAGAACQSAEDCMPACCACPAGKKFDEALVAACVEGHCIDAQTACCGLAADIQNEQGGAVGPCD
ncbi:MAG: hypothetical protein ACRELY_03845, partial [Polyangiaceae bacterium]